MAKMKIKVILCRGSDVFCLPHCNDINIISLPLTEPVEKNDALKMIDSAIFAICINIFCMKKKIRD